MKISKHIPVQAKNKELRARVVAVFGEKYIQLAAKQAEMLNTTKKKGFYYICI